MGRLHYELRTDDEKTGDARILICTKRPSLRGASSSPSLSFREQRLRPPGGNVDANDYSSRPRSICPLTVEDEDDSFYSVQFALTTRMHGSIAADCIEARTAAKAGAISR